ncbi:MAG: hypothetical protein KDA65_06625 [Planctomycetaceae bacterium]|nr:hypothetical protein [Planctomycetaceae bacterium]
MRRLLSVHALGQYVFCPRSAILAVEKGDERDVDEPLPRFTYLPNFDLEKIDEAFADKVNQFLFYLLFSGGLIVLLKMALDQQNRVVFYPCLLALLGLAWGTFQVFISLLDLALRRRAARQAEAREPEPMINKMEPVNWWSLLKAGLEPIRYQHPIPHPEFPLEGVPWRVLQRGSLRIPVIKSGQEKLGPKKGELYPKHKIRLAAYALLLESTGRFDVPYGLVFSHDSPQGLAWPISVRSKEKTIQLLEEFARALYQSQAHRQEPRPPQEENRCTRCEYGKPTPITERELRNLRKSDQAPLTLQDDAGKLFHCECGDRFGSVPPHGIMLKKKLQPIIDK